MSCVNTSSCTNAVPNLSRRILRLACRLLVLIAIGIMLSLVILVGQWLQQDSAKLFLIGLDGMRNVIGAVFLIAVVFGALCLFCRFSRRTILILVLSLVCVGLGLSQLVQVDGYYGNRTPRLIWRWKPKAEERVRMFLASKSSPARIDRNVTLFEPTDSDCGEILGRHRDGHFDSVVLQANWDENTKPIELWRHPVGLGWSSFAIVGQVAVDLEQRDSNECIVCYDVKTGEELWCHSEPIRFGHEYGDGPRSTPTIRGGRVYSMGAQGTLTCIELQTGHLLWKRDTLDRAHERNLIFGMCGSPVVMNEQVLVTPGVEPGTSAICFEASTGQELWRTGEDPGSYASPMGLKLGEHIQWLSFNGEGLRAYSPSGEPLWLQPWVTQGESRVNVAQPIFVSCESNDSGALVAKFVISSGYDKGTALVRVMCDKGKWNSSLVWESNQLKSKLSNIVVVDEHIYGLDNGILACLRLEDGKRTWKSGRYGHGKLIVAKDTLLVQAESGEIVLVAADPKAHRELASHPALESKTWNYPALAGNLLVVRNDREAAAFMLP
jgi:outer membrane protein assembly factor BamB